MASRRGLGLGLSVLALVFAGIAGATWVNRTQRSQNGLITEVETSQRPVQVVTLEPADLTETLETTGVLMPNRDVILTAEVGGEVKRVYKELGDRCRKGELLLKLDSGGYEIAVAQARAQVKQGEVALEHSQRDFERVRRLKDRAAVATQQLDSMEGAARAAAATLEQARAGLRAAQRNLRETRITCPFSGHVAGRMVDVGQMVDPRTPLARLVDIDRLKLSLSVTADQLVRIRVGQNVTLSDSARPTLTVVGTVSRLGVAADEATRTFPVEVVVQQGAEGLRAGQVMRASLHLGEHRGVLAVPVEAVTRDGDAQRVFVVRQGKARRVVVTAGAQVRQHLVIHSGLSPGDRVITVGSDDLEDGARVVVTPMPGAASPPAASPKAPSPSSASSGP